MNSDDNIADDSESDDETLRGPDDIDFDFGMRDMMSQENLSLDQFYKKGKFIVSVKEKKNFWSQAGKHESLLIPQENMNEFMKLLDNQRCSKSTASITEYQYPDIAQNPEIKTGLYIDFDTKHLKRTINITMGNYRILIQYIVENLMKIIQIEKKIVTYAAVTIKPHAVQDSNNSNYYRYGFHFIIPGLQLTKGEKQYFYRQLEQNEDIHKYLKRHMSVINYRKSIDIQSFCVPTLLVGSSKSGCKPYDLCHIFKIETRIFEDNSGYNNDDESDDDDETDILPDVEVTIEPDEFLLNNKKFNPVHEFCLGYAPKRAFIQRFQLNIRSELKQNIVQPTIMAAPIDFENADMIHLEEQIKKLERNYADVPYIKNLLMLINHVKEGVSNRWFNVTVVLAHYSSEFKPLAEYWWRLDKDNWTKWSHNFNAEWIKALQPELWKNNMVLGCLSKWAREDHPKEYEDARQNSTYTKIKKIIHTRYTKGSLGDFDWAEILYLLLKDIYVADYESGTNNLVLYEYVSEFTACKTGEIYKWRKCKNPESLLIYISRTLPEYCETIIDQLQQCGARKDNSKETSTYYDNILKNFLISMSSLSSHRGKMAIIAELQALLTKRGFIEKLDKNPMTLGVGNGILKLDVSGNPEELVQSANEYYVSRYTQTNYPENGFDPDNPEILRLLLAIRKMFPNNEPDTHLFMMCFLASTLDKLVKTGLFVMCTGEGRNGKSFLLELHRNMLGDSNTNGYSAKMRITALTQQSKNPESPSSGIMQLKDSRIAHYSESNEGEILRSDIMKELTGGETITGRYLHQNMVSFRPNCQHILTSNNELQIDSNDYGTWRRIKYIILKMLFCDPDDDNSPYDPNNPYHRVGDSDLLEKYANEPKHAGAWLAIMVFYHRIFMKYFNGKIEKIPHTHIKQETREFRARQNTYDEFIRRRIVQITAEDKGNHAVMIRHDNYEPTREIDVSDDDSDDDQKQEHLPKNKFYGSVNDMIEQYKVWYDLNFKPIQHSNLHIRKSFRERSMLSGDKYLEIINGECWMKGWRALEATENTSKNTVFFVNHLSTQECVESKIPKKCGYILPITETPSDYIKRVKFEFKRLNGESILPNLNPMYVEPIKPIIPLKKCSILQNTRIKKLHRHIQQKHTMDHFVDDLNLED